MIAGNPHACVARRTISLAPENLLKDTAPQVPLRMEDKGLLLAYSTVPRHHHY